MPRRFWQPLHDLHLAATLRTGRPPFNVSGGRRGAFRLNRCRIGVLGCWGDLLLRGRRQQLADPGELCCTIAVGKEAVMADALEAVGQDVEEKATDELLGLERHVLDARAVPIVLPGERDVVVGDLDKAMIGDGDAVRIAAQIPENLLGPGKGRLAVDHPIDLPERGKVGPKRALLRQRREIGEEVQALVIVSSTKFLKEQSSEQT